MQFLDSCLEVVSEYYEQIHTKRLCELVGALLTIPSLRSFFAAQGTIVHYILHIVY